MTDQVQWVRVATAQNEWDAEVTRQQLQAVDIPVVLEPAGARAYLGASSPFAIKVPAERVTEAQDALEGREEIPMQTTFDSATDLAQALRRASEAHGEHEKRTGEADANWPDWYAEYMVKERAGEELPT